MLVEDTGWRLTVISKKKNRQNVRISGFIVVNNHVVNKWLAKDVAAVKPYQPGKPIEELARELGIEPDSILKLASNENPLGASLKAKQAIRNCCEDVFRYPDDGAYKLTQALSDYYAQKSEQFLIGAGSNQIIELIGHAFAGPAKSILVSEHAFISYKLIGNLFGAEVIEVPTRGLGHDLDAMAKEIRKDTSVVFVCNPNNPTGTILSPMEIEAFLQKVPDDVLVVFDEAYAEIALAEMPAILDIINRYTNCIVLRTFSKAYGMAGLRVGYAIGPEPIIGALRKARQPFNVTLLAQAAATEALFDQTFIRKGVDLFAESKVYVESELDKAGISYEPTYTNFILIHVGDGASVTQALLENGVIVRPMAGYGLAKSIRVNFGLMPENKRFVQSLKKVLDQ